MWPARVMIGMRGFWLGAGALVCARLLLLLGRPVALQPWPEDDRLYVRQAVHLLNGSWLGPYDELTLIKGSGFPIFLAGSHLSGLPLSVVEGLLYSIAVLLFCLALRPAFARPGVLLVLFAVLEFEPMVFSSTRVLREPFCSALVLSTFAGAFALYLRQCRQSRLHPLSLDIGDGDWPLVPWALLCGTSLGMLWITREEGVWLVPPLLLLAVLLLVRVWSGARDREIVRRALASVVGPVSVAVAIVIAVASLNLYVYGVFRINDQTSGAFSTALETIQSIEHSDVEPRVHVPKAARRELYRVSDRFRELEPTLETPRWYAAGCNAPRFPCNDINSGWLSWAIRYAAAESGHYESAASAEAFFAALNEEIESACRAGALDCGWRGVGLLPPPTKWEWSHAGRSMQRFVRLAVLYRCCRVQQDGRTTLSTFRDLVDVTVMARITNASADVISALGDPVELERAAGGSAVASTFLDRILSVYRMLTPILLVLLVVALVWMGMRRLAGAPGSEDETALVLIAVLATAVLSRMAVLFAVELGAFPAFNVEKWQLAQPLLLAAGIVGGGWIFERFRNGRP